MRADFEETRMPAGGVCYFRERDHSYWEGCKPKSRNRFDDEWQGVGRLTGVTTCVKPFDWKPDYLIRWAVKQNLREIAARARLDIESASEGDLWHTTDWLTKPDLIEEEITTEEGKWPDEVARDEAGTRGTNVHLYTLQALATGKALPDYDLMSQEERGYASGVVQFWLDHGPRATIAEQIVCDLGLRVAGRLDFKGRLHRECENWSCPCHDLKGLTIILDLKTSGYIGVPAHVQVAGYDHLARVSGFGPSNAQLILKVTAEGEYSVMRSHATRADFLAALEIYRREQAISKAARLDRKNALAAAS